MKLIWHVKRFIKKNELARYLIDRRKRRLYREYGERYSDREFVELLYRRANNGVAPDLEAPQTFTEKLQWLKLFYRNPLLPIASDKVEAKKYVADCGYPELVIPTVAVYDSADAVDVSALPSQFALKASHGSGWNIICHDKAKINWKKKKREMAGWLSDNLYLYGREWNYKEQTPRLLVEELVDTKPLVDYKFMCFGGKVRAMQVNHDNGGVHYVDFYDAEWNLIPDMSTGVAPHSDIRLPRPAQFDEMKAIAEDLAKPFPFVRVDLYNVNGKIYFGEMTFFPGSGFWTVTPHERNLEFGSWLTLPEKNSSN